MLGRLEIILRQRMKHIINKPTVLSKTASENAHLRMEYSSLNSHLYRKPNHVLVVLLKVHIVIFSNAPDTLTSGSSTYKTILLIITLMSYYMVQGLRPISKMKLYS